MLDRAPLEIVPPHLRTPWRGLDSGRLKGGKGTTAWQVKTFIFILIFLDKRLFLDIAYVSENSEPIRVN